MDRMSGGLSGRRFQSLVDADRLNVEGAVEAGTVVLHRDRRHQLYQLLAGEVTLRLSELVVADLNWSLCHPLGKDERRFLLRGEEIAFAERRNSGDLLV
jgi:hypothetical protein